MNFKDHQPKAPGSFGIPEEIKEAHSKQQQRKAAKESTDDKKYEGNSGAEASEPDAKADDTRPENILGKLGAKFGEDDFNQLLFKGTYETTIDAIKGRLTAKFKTLTSDEYDQVDEILAKEMKDIDMTQDGLRTRSSMWVISYGVIELNGKLVAKPVKDSAGKVDSKATAAARREVFAAMAPAIVNQLIQKHGAITVAINTIAADPTENLKNS